MLSKKQNARKSREYYKTHKKYRAKRIEDRKEYYHDHRESQNAYARRYYHANPEYRSKKIEQARAWQRKNRSRKKR